MLLTLNRFNLVTAGLAISALLLFPLPNFALGGGMDGGGGRSVVCRDNNGKITSAELLDLYEGRIQFGLTIHSKKGNVQSQIEKAEAKLKQSIRIDFKWIRTSVYEHFKFLPKGTKLAMIDDSHELILPKYCKVEQVANFMNLDLILIDSEIWNKFDNTNKAALIIHEVLYLRARGFGAKDSRHSRYINAHLFAENVTFDDIYDGIPAEAMACMAYSKPIGVEGNQVSMFYVYKLQDGWRLQFSMLGGRQIFSKKIVDTSDFFDFEAYTEREPNPTRIGSPRITLTTLQSKIENNDVFILELGKVTYYDRWAQYRLFLNGQSGWDPSGVYDKAEIVCSKDQLKENPIPPKN